MAGRFSWLARAGAAAAIAAGLAAASVPLARATGFGSDNPPARIPVPARDFRATVEDRGGRQLTVTRVTWNGEVFVYGAFGDAQLTVPFEKIREITVADGGGEGKRIATITSLDGRTLELTVADDLLCYGRTEFGNYQLEVRDLRRISGIEAISEGVPKGP